MQATSSGIAGKVCRQSRQKRKHGSHNRRSKPIRMSRLCSFSEQSTDCRPDASVGHFGGIHNFEKAPRNFFFKFGVKNQSGKSLYRKYSPFPRGSRSVFFVRGHSFRQAGVFFLLGGAGGYDGVLWWGTWFLPSNLGLKIKTNSEKRSSSQNLMLLRGVLSICPAFFVLEGNFTHWGHKK